ncbi:facilitated trehalose transporter Tret1-2 homolog [Phymastichus coffea]|uniref:facilitated trehalose transporter Tret1-2 homolog n=1 Tax=Phymastichus coffea TaxID=108790 RepID=UPI00273C1A23|nr:facilitated trehalose transporter Tret1-2 homolog [Phymastichus coffea]
MSPTTNEWLDGQGEEKQLADEERQTPNSQRQNAIKEYVYGPGLGTQVYQPTIQPRNYCDNDNCDERTDLVKPGQRAIIKFEMELEGGSKILQFVAATAANLCILASGAMMGWTSPVLSYMSKNSTEPVDPENPLGYNITSEENSWVGSIMTIGAVVGSLISGYLGERFGRKKALLFSAVPYLIGWILVATTKSLEQLYAARFIFGVALAIDFTIVPMYCGEIAETSIRGVLGSFLQLFVTVGLLFSYCIGPYVSYTVFWIACGSLPIIFFVCFMFMPESPYYLLAQGMKDDAAESLAKLRGKNVGAVQKELGEMQTAVDQAFSTEVKMSDLFTVKSNFKALLYTCAAVSFQQLTGINVVLFYTQDIFKSAGTSLDPAICTILVGAVQLAASGVTPVIVDRLGRRTLLIISGIGTSITTGSLGVYFYLQSEKNAEGLGWLPVASLIVFVSLYCIGWGPLPWAIMGEMFSSEVKAKASGITVLICWAFAFVITKYFSTISNAYGNHTAFWIFTVFCILSIVFALMLLPETRGKSLKQIQSELSGTEYQDEDEELGEPTAKM